MNEHFVLVTRLGMELGDVTGFDIELDRVTEFGMELDRVERVLGFGPKPLLNEQLDRLVEEPVSWYDVDVLLELRKLVALVREPLVGLHSQVHMEHVEERALQA